MAKFTWILIAAAGATAVAAVGAWAWSTQNVETPDYTLEKADGAIEIRRYPALVIAKIEKAGNRGEAVRAAFSPLARYITAKERPGEKIAMTAPVTQGRDDDDWVVSFIMPSGRTLEDLPTPTGSVTLAEIPPRRVAAIRFSGRWTDDRFAEAKDRLMAWVSAQGLVPSGTPQYAYYNDPFTPPFLRRNEVLIDISVP
ncbi:MAG: heme-binding protein [Pseudomonadota bacterium]